MILYIAILRHRLWDINILVNRALVYGSLSTVLGVVYLISILLLQSIFRSVTDQNSPLAVAVSTLAIAALFNPFRYRIQGFIDRRFFRERVDFQQALRAFAEEIHTFIDMRDLLHGLVQRTLDLLHVEYGGVFMATPDRSVTDKRIFRVVEAHNLPPPDSGELTSLLLDQHTVNRLQKGSLVERQQESIFPLLVPLLAPSPVSALQPSITNPNSSYPAASVRASTLLAVLALGPRRSGQNYSRDEQNLLSGLARQAGTALHVAQLVEEKQAEAKRREESEKLLAAHRQSPTGRAEAIARQLLATPEQALIELYCFAQRAEQDPEALTLLNKLPGAFEHYRAEALAAIADGFNYLFMSDTTPELLKVSIRRFVVGLEHPEAAQFKWSAPTLAFYKFCGQALVEESVGRIASLAPMLEKCDGMRVWADLPNVVQPCFQALVSALASVSAAMNGLCQCDRTATPGDKLLHLAGAVEHLRRVETLTQTGLGDADRLLFKPLAENWLAVATEALIIYQTRAQIRCRLLTHRVWRGSNTTLVFSLRNEGRGEALALTLAPAPELILADELTPIERLGPGEEFQLELRVNLFDCDDCDNAPVRFNVTYIDSRGPTQVEAFADTVYFLAHDDSAPFQNIFNPYVVGTPLQPGSPLFFGRDELFTFIQSNLTSAHRNNLVLVGQRRTGKTSLLKQLPVRLGEAFFSIYLDGQGLTIDPGLPNFFLTLATMMTLALDEQGFAGDPPSLDQFASSPAHTFEYQFLPRVRQLIGERHLLLLFDEFEELELAVRRGGLDPSIFSFLRHFIQHTPDLSVIFCGTHKLEQLTADYWNVLFNISLHRQVGYLEQHDAWRLIQEPVDPFGMQYDDLALEKMWRITGGHPYFLQLLCHSLVNYHNRSRRDVITIADVNATLDEIVTAGQAHFVYLWNESTPHEQLVLATLSRVLPLPSHLTPAQLSADLTRRGTPLDEPALREALERLAARDVLAMTRFADNTCSDSYRWQLGLLRLWVAKYRPLATGDD